MRTKRLLLYSFLFICFFPWISNAQKTKVKVVFKVVEKDYVENFNVEDLKKVESVGADSIASLFNRFIPLFEFTSSDNAEDSLMINLERREFGSIFSFFVDWKVRIRGKNVKSIVNDHTWEFLNSEKYATVLKDDPIAFVNEIYLILEKKLNKNINQTDLIEKIFNQIKLAGRVDEIDLNQKKWILPYTYEYLNIGRNSEFLMDHLFLVVEHSALEGKVVGEPGQGKKILIKSDQSLGNYTIQQFTKMYGVYIIYYNPLKASNNGF